MAVSNSKLSKPDPKDGPAVAIANYQSLTPDIAGQPWAICSKCIVRNPDPQLDLAFSAVDRCTLRT